MKTKILFLEMVSVKNVSLGTDEIQHIQKVRGEEVYRLSGGNYLADRR